MTIKHTLVTFEGELIDFFEQNLRTRARVVCPSCGFEFENFAKTGRLGCSKCYDIFHDQIMRHISK